MMDPILKGAKNFIPFGGGSVKKYAESLVLEKAKDMALKNTLVIYDVYKKTHGMLSW